MKDNDLINLIGKLAYRRSDFVKFLAEDMAISRNRLAMILKGGKLSAKDKAQLKYLCERQADKLHQAALDLMDISENL